jgi:quercetin dioxygenase-like cupin family protein
MTLCQAAVKWLTTLAQPTTHRQPSRSREIAVTSQFFAVNAASLPWEERFSDAIGKAIFRKELFSDPETGMLVRLVRYPAGVINPAHTHPCGHGMYVLEGTLVTHKGRFGPGSFVWFPEGEVMEHGASADGDVVVVFVTNKPFQIHYVPGVPG